MKAVHIGAGLAAAAMLATACHVVTGETQHETTSIELDKSDAARVELRMGAGELQVASGTSKFADADFTYNVAAWKPIVDHEPGKLTITQPNSSGGSFGRTENKWRLKLNDRLRLDLIAHLGAGEATLDLGSLNLNRVEINVGAGELKLDLRGDPKRDYHVQIHGGVGQATVRLPKDVAIAATATGGIGGISTTGLEKRNGVWINPEHVTAPVTVHVDATGGVGEISLIR